MLHKGPMPNEFTPFTEFAQLRLTEFLGAHPALLGKVAHMNGGWEFMGGAWLGEGLGFTDFLCLETMPEELGCLSLSLADLPEEVSAAVFARLGLPLRRRMTCAEIDAHLGLPERQYLFVADRKSFDYTVGSEWPYHVGCTVHDRDGLIHVVVARKDVLARCEPQ
jgi:hypothetical protein